MDDLLMPPVINGLTMQNENSCFKTYITEYEMHSFPGFLRKYEKSIEREGTLIRDRRVISH